MPDRTGKPRILLLGWDAADWQVLMPLVEQGLMPSLAGLMARGAWGNLASLQPMISPMLWTTIATGMTADRHGVLGFVEPADHDAGIRPWSSLNRRCKAVWNILQQNGWRSHQIAWWASHPAEPMQGVVIADTIRENPVPQGSVHPASATAHYASLRMSPAELGAAHLLPFVPRAAEIDQDNDRRLATVARLLSDAAGIHAMATEAMEQEPWDFAAVYFDALDHFCHAFMPYHPPRMPHISADDFELYHGVVAAACRFHDMMLARLLEIAGPETNVVLCSDHGFLSGSSRPLRSPNDPAGPALWHRDMGVLVMAGPGIQPGARVPGASLLDITPTLLALAGLPCGRDMPGMPLTAVLADPEVPPRISSWEEVPGDCGRHPEGTSWGSAPGHGLLVQRLADLGYLNDPAEDNREAAAAARREARSHLAQAHLAMGNPEEAVQLLEPLVQEKPWESRWIHQLANALTKSGWYLQSVGLLKAAWPREGPEDMPPAVRLLAARALLGCGQPEAARWHLSRALNSMPRLAAVQVELGTLALEMGEFILAERALRRALELDDSFAAAWEGLSTVHLRNRHYDNALKAAGEALALVRQLPQALLNQGLALARLGRNGEAREAFRKVVELRPDDDKAWRFLAVLPDHSGGGAFLLSAVREEVRRISRRRARDSERRRHRAAETWALPAIPSPAERRERTDRERPLAAADAGGDGRVLTLVSGLPRSGTSLMMQMLAAGGLAPQSDGRRSRDEDNPEGYHEWEAIRQLAANPAILEHPDLERRAVKCISALLPVLPARHRYRVIFMRRPIAEIAASQDAMLRRRGAAGPDIVPIESAMDLLRRHLDEGLRFLEQHPRFFEVLEIDYPSLVATPEPWIERIAAFLGPDLLPHPERMAAAVQPALHRQTMARLSPSVPGTPHCG